MGYCPKSTKSMGEFAIEIRRESFCISSDSEFYLYPRKAYEKGGTIEISITDIPKIEACIRSVKRHLAAMRGKR